MHFRVTTPSTTLTSMEMHRGGIGMCTSSSKLLPSVFNRSDRFVDAILIVTAVALMFVPVVGPLATIAMGALTGALLGAGIAGLNADIAGKSTKDWGIAMGIGALTGAITGAASAGLNVALPSLSMSTQAAKFGKYAVREVQRAIINKVVGTGTEALGRVIDNVAHGRDADYGLVAVIPGMGDLGPLGWVETAASFGKRFFLNVP